MLLWPTFVVLTAFGIGTFLLGHLMNWTGVAAIGAVIVLATGGGVAISDLTVRDGEQIQRSYDTINNSTVETQTTIDVKTDRTSLTKGLGGDAGPLSVGGLQMLIGGLLMTQHLTERSL